MKIEYTLEEIKSALEGWSELVTPVYIDGVNRVDSDLIINYLNQGFCFRFTLEDFKAWDAQNPDYLHAYPAIFNGKLKFVLIDSTSDQYPQKDTLNIKVFDFFYGEMYEKTEAPIPENNMVSLPLVEALQRNFTWKMHCRRWLADQDGEIFKAIVIPFEDCRELFQPPVSEIIISDPDQSAIAFLGLKKRDLSEKLDIEFILTNEQAGYNLPKTSYDISRPVPPFHHDECNFQLLPVVDYSNGL